MANSDPFSASIIPFEVPEQMSAFAEKGTKLELLVRAGLTPVEPNPSRAVESANQRACASPR